MVMSDTISYAIALGKKHHRAGNSPDLNPYEPNDPCFDAYLDGWHGFARRSHGKSWSPYSTSKLPLLDRRGVPYVGKRILISQSVIPRYRGATIGVVTRSGACGHLNGIPEYVYVKLERPGFPRFKLYEYAWALCREVPDE